MSALSGFTQAALEEAEAWQRLCESRLLMQSAYPRSEHDDPVLYLQLHAAFVGELMRLGDAEAAFAAAAAAVVDDGP